MVRLSYIHKAFWQVLYLVDPIDEVALSSLGQYKDKKFVDISKEDLDLGNYSLMIIVGLIIVSWNFANSTWIVVINYCGSVINTFWDVWYLVIFLL